MSRKSDHTLDNLEQWLRGRPRGSRHGSLWWALVTALEHHWPTSSLEQIATDVLHLSHHDVSKMLDQAEDHVGHR